MYLCLSLVLMKNYHLCSKVVWNMMFHLLKHGVIVLKHNVSILRFLSAFILSPNLFIC
jgi:hypothetical protein